METSIPHPPDFPSRLPLEGERSRVQSPRIKPRVGSRVNDCLHNPSVVYNQPKKTQQHQHQQPPPPPPCPPPTKNCSSSSCSTTTSSSSTIIKRGTRHPLTTTTIAPEEPVLTHARARARARGARGPQQRWRRQSSARRARGEIECTAGREGECEGGGGYAALDDS